MIAVTHRILCFGDSNTYGYDPRSCLGGRYPASVRWTGLLRSAGWAVINEGENGRCIPQLDADAKELSHTALQAETDMIAVMLGSNDLLRHPRPSAEVCTERMERFLTTLLEEVPVPCKILLIAPPPMKAGAWVDDSGALEGSRRLAGCYEVLAQRLGIPFADAGAWNVELTFDGIHFSETGHRAFAEGMRSTLKTLFDPQLTDAIDLSR